MPPLLKRMEKQNLVRRTRNPQDDRSVTVTLAPGGVALRVHADGIYRSFSETFDFSPKRAGAALAFLRSIVERAGAREVE
jgi:DNA-binding MarR family transcriptional regulator